MNIVLTVTDRLRPKRIGWIGLQPDGSVSVGLSDRAFISPDFKARNFVWNAYNRVTLNYVVESDTEALMPVKNPHLTFHPPIYFHLTGGKGKHLYEGIADLEIMLSQEGIVPWVRFISKPISRLPTAGVPRQGGNATVLNFNAPNSDCSIGLAIDFVRSGYAVEKGDAALQEVINWQSYQLAVSAHFLKPQNATLAWFHQK